ncbi:MAG: type II CRISPR-associated endonuclease Cas1 [Mariprofundaceae bacterium]|nr:type II CRISPR-associated endonuclease Cas1 [Mariprofundaceae bacterium]
MIKRIIEISTAPAYISVKGMQLVLKREGDVVGSVPIEDIGVLIVDHPGCTYSHAALNELLANNVAVVICGKNHHPNGLLLPLDGHSVQSERYRVQTAAKEPVKKRLWKQVVQAKIRHQAWCLDRCEKEGGDGLRLLANKVKSGDKENHEAQAAARYWKLLLGKDFRRRRDGLPPNGMLNYGYTILRAAVARALCGGGLHPSFGLHHHNRYNAYPLADDLMEPFRPLIDYQVFQYWRQGEGGITSEVKKSLLGVLSQAVFLASEERPLMNALHFLSANLLRGLAGDDARLIIPTPD